MFYKKENLYVNKQVLFSGNKVAQLCVDFNFFNNGVNEDYSEMLIYVNEHYINPSEIDLYYVAKTIFENSVNEGFEISDILTLLANKCCITTFDIIPNVRN